MRPLFRNETLKYNTPFYPNAMENQYNRGTYFKEHNHPTIRGKVIVETTDDLHGEPGYRIAEKDTSDESERDWFAYWMPARQLHDEIGIGAVEEAGQLESDQLDAVEENIKLEEAEEVTPIDEVTRVRDVVPQSFVEAVVNTRS